MARLPNLKRVAGITALAATAGAIATAFAVRKALQPGRDFEGKTVVVTGGSRGLGLALCREFGNRGARMATCARRPEELADAQRLLEAKGIDCYTEVCDVTRQDDVRRFLQNVRDRFGSIDVLVNNAGIIGVGPVQNQTVADFEEAMAINFWGAVYGTLEVLSEMTQRGHGNIVNISSIGGKVAVPHLLPYSASKFALAGFSEGLRAELHRTGVRVTTVCPGLMRTGSQVQALCKGQHEKEYAWFMLSSATPLSSIKAERAARQIVNATKKGQAELIITWQAELLARTHGLAPELVAQVLAFVNTILPDPAPDGHLVKKAGHESETMWTRNPVSLPIRAAANRLNEKHA